MAELVDALGLGPSRLISVRVRVSPLAHFNMINILHNWQPPNILFFFFFITIYWYGFIIALSIVLGYLLILKLSKYFSIKKQDLENLALYLIIFSILGARIYEVLFIEFNYYFKNPLEIIKIWQGGLAIHGAIIFGIIFLYFYSKKKSINFYILTANIVPGLILGQIIGRFGNWFNQELFGLPTNIPWAIPIEISNRPIEYINYSHFHPTFLYESIINIFILLIIIFIIKKYYKSWPKIKLSKIIFYLYLLLYSINRLLVEFFRIDITPEFLGLRWPQLLSIFVIIISLFYLIKITSKNKKLTSYK